MSQETKNKIALSVRLFRINDIISKNGIMFPNFNINACKLIYEYGIKNGYNFKTALSGSEYHIKELGYWVDGYDEEQNVVIEFDENHHFDKNGNLSKKDMIRQIEICSLLKCKFIRLKLNELNEIIDYMIIL
jgi:hypothetical protein